MVILCVDEMDDAILPFLENENIKDPIKDNLKFGENKINLQNEQQQ